MKSQHWLEPDWRPNVSVPNLPLKHFLDKNIKALLLDVDGTLLTGREVIIHDSVIKWIKEARLHLKLHLLSNNPSRKRIGNVAKKLDLTFTYGAAKPRRKSAKKVLDELKLNPNQISLVGDRIFTDVLTGNRLGLYTVLVKPLGADGSTNQNNKIQAIEDKVACLFGAKHK